MRTLVPLLLIIVSVVCAVGAGAGSMLTRNVLDPSGFSDVVVHTVQSPAGLALVRTSVENNVANRAAAQPAIISNLVATTAGDWAVSVFQGDAARQVLGPVATGLQQGILNGDSAQQVQIDVRAMAAASTTPPLISRLLDSQSGDVLVTVPWVSVSPQMQYTLRELDRHRMLPAGLAVVALVAGLLAVMLSKRRGFALLVLGIALAAAAFLLRPIATTASGLFINRGSQGGSASSLAPTVVEQVFTGWSAVSGALIAIGLALALAGAVLSLRRRA
ncbi:MAG: hypothetical protein WCO40_08460 [Thermoleophilia bacterium]